MNIFSKLIKNFGTANSIALLICIVLLLLEFVGDRHGDRNSSVTILIFSPFLSRREFPNLPEISISILILTRHRIIYHFDISLLHSSIHSFFFLLRHLDRPAFPYPSISYEIDMNCTRESSQNHLSDFTNSRI